MALFPNASARPTRKLCPTLTSSFLYHFRELHTSKAILREAVQWSPILDSRFPELRSEGRTWKEIGNSLNILPTSCHRRYRYTIETCTIKFLDSRTDFEIATELGAGQEKYQISALGCQEYWYKINRGSARLRHGGGNGSDEGARGSSIYFSKRDVELLQQRVDEIPTKDGTSKEPLDTNKKLDWEELARDVFKNRFTVEQLQFKLATLSRESRRWTKERDSVLIDHVMKRVGDDDQDEHIWLKASQSLELCTPEDCKTRWMNLKGIFVRYYNVSRSSSIWTDEEIRTYWTAWRSFGNDRDQVSKAVNSVEPSDMFENQQDDALSPKTAKDCKDDFKYLMALSIAMSTRLEREHQRLARGSLERRSRVQWTEDQLERLVEVVKTEAMNSPMDINWKAVAQRIGSGATGSQCKTQWLSHQKAVDSIPYTRAQWGQSDISKLKRALVELKLFGSADRLPPLSARLIQINYDFHQPSDSIRRQAQKILGANLHTPPHADA
ncbi:hypothetical protein BGX26_011874 [Mortierella sp. AD094]|nr:hypothetical protein BGX26_011874 [Mortierella sp. AD094]